MQLLEHTRVLPTLQVSPAILVRVDAQLQRQLLPRDPGVEHDQHSLRAQTVRHRPRTGRLLRPRRQHRLDHRPQLVVHDPRLHAHTHVNGPSSHRLRPPPHH